MVEVICVLLWIIVLALWLRYQDKESERKKLFLKRVAEEQEKEQEETF